MLQNYRFNAQTTWDTIAESFDTTRQKPWKYCVDFIQNLPPETRVADLGCGNGRHLIPAAQQCTYAIGVDISQRFLQIITKKIQQRPQKNIMLIHADIVHLPFSDQSLDAVLCIASLHNIQGKEHRHTALQEITRVLKPQGTALISVWSRWQDKYYKHFLKQLISQKQNLGDIDILWKQHNLNIPRFYHLYSKTEFQTELHQAGLQIQHIESIKIHSKRFTDNYFAIVKKE
jgi:tRNA (uracil-5-)-methyltransferase TRM9